MSRAILPLTLAIIGALASGRSGAAAELAYVTTEWLSAVEVIDTARGTVVRQIPLDLGDGHVGLSADGQRAWVIDRDRAALVEIELSTMMVLRRIHLGGLPRRLALTADSATAYVAGAPTLAVDLFAGTIVTLTPLETSDVVLSADDRQVLFALPSPFGADVHAVLGYEPATGALRQRVSGLYALRVVLSPDRRRAYVDARPVDDGARTRLVTMDALTLEVVGDVPGSATLLGASPDGGTLYAAGSPNQATALSRIDAVTGAYRGRVELGVSVFDATVTSNGIVAAIDLGGRALVLRDMAGAAPVRRVALDSRPYSLAAAADGETVAVATDTGLRIVVVATGEVVAHLPAGRGATGIAATDNGRQLVVANYGSGSVSIVDTARGVVAASIATGGRPLGVAVTPDERRAYVGSFGNRGPVYAIDLETNALLAAIEVAGEPAGIAVTPDGRRVLVAGNISSLLSIIDVASNTVVDEFRVFDGPIGVAMRRDGLAWVTLQTPAAALLIDPSGVGPRQRETLPLPFTLEPCVVTANRDATRVWVAGESGGVVLVDPAAQSVMATARTAAPYAAESCGVALSADERTLYLANNSNDLVTVLDANTLATIDQIPVAPRPFAIALACPGGCPPPPSTATSSPRPTMTPIACAGDCEGDGRVSIADVVLAVRIATADASLSRCAGIDANGDGEAAIDELVRVVAAALGACGR